MIRRDNPENPVWKLIIKYLQEYKALSVFQLSDLIKVHYKNLRIYLKHMHTANVIYIDEWRASEKKVGRKFPIWALNPEGDILPDEPKPRAKTHVQIMRERRRKERLIKTNIFKRLIK